MKIEIGESLSTSFLKHVHGCRIVQTNWKTSDRWVITEKDKGRSKKFFDRIVGSNHFSDIFKGSSYNQLLKQAEIDVLGINTSKSTVYGIDVAFHGAGLNYGSKEESSNRILKKIFRTLFIMQTYFDQYDKFESLFITPKTNPSTLTIIKDLIEKANELIDDQNITIRFITNEDFYSEIIDTTLSESVNENDTSELFLRSMKLIELDPRKSNDFKNITSSASEKKFKKNSVSINKRTKDGMKIGQYVRYTLQNCFEMGLISNDEIQRLQDPVYSKKIFNSNFEVLRLKTRSIKDSKGRNRYYSKQNFCGDYYLSSQWIESQWDFYINWLKKIKYFKVE